MKLGITQKLLIFSFVILAGNGFLGYAVYESNQKLLNSEQWVQHTTLVISQSVKVRSVSKDIETAARGYLITKDPTFLEPLYNGRKTIFIYIAQLRQLVADNPGQIQRIDSLNFYSLKLLNFSLKSVEIRNKRGLAEAIDFTSAGDGKHFNDQIHKVTDAIQLTEGNLLKERTQANSLNLASFNQFTVLMFISLGGFTILLIIIIYKYILQNTEMAKRAAELLIANKELLFQSEEKGKRAAELLIANNELLFQSDEKGKRAAELLIANNELLFQNNEKGKRATELDIANIELSFQNEEKNKRADELKKANRLYRFISEVNQKIVRTVDEKNPFP